MSADVYFTVGLVTIIGLAAKNAILIVQFGLDEEARGVPVAGVERIEGSDLDVVPQLSRLKQAGADTLLLVANVAPSAQVVQAPDGLVRTSTT